MLCPEVWDFKAPQHYFQIEHGDCQTKSVSSVIKTHYFNHSVSIVLPDTTSIPRNLQDILTEDSDYYKVEGLPAFALVNKQFVEAFVKKGQLSLLTVGNKIDLHNSVAIVPSGQLILSLEREDFQKLGLEGKASFFTRRTPTRFVVTIDLKEDTFTPGKKNYERVRECLEKQLKQRFNVIVAWDPPEENICPSSVAAWFHNLGYTVSLCRQKFIWRSEFSVTVPVVENNCDYDKLFEWIGVFSIAGDLKSDKEENYVNTYECPTPTIDVGQVRYLQWTGFFTYKQIERVYNTLKEYILSKRSSTWGSLHVQGFADSPVSWDLKEHTFFTNGDNSRTIVFQSNGKYILRRSLASNNKPRIFQ